MIGLAVVFLAVLLTPLVIDDLPAYARTVLDLTGVGIWAIFLIDYVVRLYLAPQRWRFVRTNITDLVIIALPVVRPLRVLRAVRLLRVLRLAALAGRIEAASRRSPHVRAASWKSNALARRFTMFQTRATRNASATAWSGMPSWRTGSRSVARRHPW
jgi:voltage-gated potassium channel